MLEECLFASRPFPRGSASLLEVDSALFCNLNWLRGNHLFYFSNLIEMINTYEILPGRAEMVSRIASQSFDG